MAWRFHHIATAIKEAVTPSAVSVHSNQTTQFHLTNYGEHYNVSVSRKFRALNAGRLYEFWSKITCYVFRQGNRPRPGTSLTKCRSFSHSKTHTLRGPGNSVGIATDYGLDGPGSNPGWDEIFRPSRPALGLAQPHVKWLFPAGKVRPGRAAEHSPPSSAAVMEEYSYTSTHPLGHIGNVTGTLYLFNTHTLPIDNSLFAPYFCKQVWQSRLSQRCTSIEIILGCDSKHLLREYF